MVFPDLPHFVASVRGRRDSFGFAEIVLGDAPQCDKSTDLKSEAPRPLNPQKRHQCSKQNPSTHLFKRVAKALREVAPVLQAVKDLCLFPNSPAAAHSVLPRKAREGEGDSELGGIGAQLVANDNNQRCDKCRMAAGHATGLEQLLFKISRSKSMQYHLCDFRNKRYKEWNKEEVGTEELGHMGWRIQGS